MGSSEAQASIWDPTATQRARWVSELLVPVWQVMLDVTRVRPGSRLLDAGCGSGECAALAVARGAEVSGLDCSEEMLTIARRTAAGATFVHGDLEALPYPDASFDAILACNTVHFAARPVQALRELARVARPGARIALVSMGTRDDLQLRRVVFVPTFGLLDGPPPSDPFVLSEPGALEHVVTEAGLAIATTLKVQSEWSFATFDEAWAAWRSVGPVNAVVNRLGEAPVRAAVQAAADQLVRRDTGYILRDWWRVLVAERA